MRESRGARGTPEHIERRRNSGEIERNLMAQLLLERIKRSKRSKRSESSKRSKRKDRGEAEEMERNLRAKELSAIRASKGARCLLSSALIASPWHSGAQNKRKVREQ